MHAEFGIEESEKSALDECGKKQPEECMQNSALRNPQKSTVKIQKQAEGKEKNKKLIETPKYISI